MSITNKVSAIVSMLLYVVHNSYLQYKTLACDPRFAGSILAGVDGFF